MLLRFLSLQEMVSEYMNDYTAAKLQDSEKGNLH